MNLASGALDRRITLQRALATEDDLGSPIETWVDLATVWAAKTDLSDVERSRAAEIGAVIDTRFQIRWSAQWSDLNPTDRLVYAGLTYNIAGVREIGRRQGIEISAKARAEATDQAKG